jgi:hypothetical protein
LSGFFKHEPGQASLPGLAAVRGTLGCELGELVIPFGNLEHDLASFRIGVYFGNRPRFFRPAPPVFRIINEVSHVGPALVLQQPR